MTMNLFNDKNKLKPNYPTVRKYCQSCFEEFETAEKWRKRCPACKDIDAPYRKQIVNKQISPF